MSDLGANEEGTRPRSPEIFRYDFQRFFPNSFLNADQAMAVSPAVSWTRAQYEQAIADCEHSIARLIASRDHLHAEPRNASHAELVSIADRAIAHQQSEIARFRKAIENLSDRAADPKAPA